MGKRRFTRQRKIVTLGEKSFGDVRWSKPFEMLGKQERIKARAVDQYRGLQTSAVLGPDFPALACGTGTLHTGVQHHHATCVFHIGLQTQHQRMAVNQAGAWGIQGGYT